MDSSSKKTEVLATLAEGITGLTSSEGWRKWLEAQRRFHHYSFGNTLLIIAQRPDATQVAGFHTWLRLSRHVRKGEKGIAILAPVVRRHRVADEATGEETVVIGAPSAFRIAYVFDVSQTEGAELPPAPVSKLQGDDPDDRYTQLVEVAHSLGFTVEEDYLEGGVNGDCSHEKQRIRVEVRNDPRQQVKTLAHELAHAILHASRELPRERMELEAESVAYMVCADLGIDTAAYSFGYVATWAGGGDEARKALTESAQRIQKAARLILDGGCESTEGIAA
jgi:antirestriction protein ArdC